ncbi:hypothetical protein IAQ61_009613 [Plenodomus lingam]|uniref:Uncharacterized protein n=1 Tax=Leptosphaeria maculans (strain JN3 / isolate v23.1.3 / race Av1-4-5-6-7-8) TaxID=985895 RepID=E4ZSV9_LEPMJ|nr:hypothetical protein LEMA_P120380.1 [Plenodomus lingam JN3]KAH9863336.1 hypothetical protein IAQ61_009613 [Plenodomus lingam]CBX94547.1 hypothetical protein LEMA_P120380.1 [Plenodomus lingam JN3]
MATTPATCVAPLSPAVQQSPMFHMPLELRDRVYDFIFGDSPIPPSDDVTAAVPASSELAQARLVSHQFDDEARETCFGRIVHCINWNPKAVAERPGDYTQRVCNLEKKIREQIKHIAFRIQDGNVNYIDPLHLDQNPEDPDQVSPDRLCVIRGLRLLDSVTFVLDLPFINTTEGRRTRIMQEGRLAEKISELTHVKQVTVQNIFHREQFSYHEENGQQHWKILEWEDDSDIVNDDR